jgi:hypothetical protein
MPEKTREQFEIEIQRAEAKLADARRQLSRIPGVIEVLVGIQETGGVATGEVVFQVYVDRKKPAVELSKADRIPKSVAGIATDVIGRVPVEPTDVLVGGMGLTQSLWGLTKGTMGVVAVASAANTHVPHNTPVLLTNKHVAGDVGSVVGRECLCDSWCCECCDIGRLVDAQLTDRVDGAIATLNPGVRFSHDVLGIGAIRGFGTATMNMPVVKYGNVSGFRKGTVTQDHWPLVTRTDGASFVDQIRFAPRPGETTVNERGDSGSVLIEEQTQRVVGLSHAGVGTGFANHIADVMALLHIDFPVIGTAGAIPLSAIPIAEEALTTERLIALRRDLEDTEFGQQWIELIRVHSLEVRHLVNHHRAAKVAWQRCQGPGFLAHFLKSVRDRSHRVPREISGVRLENAIVSMAAAFRQDGSPALADAVAEHYLTVLECAERAESADDAIAKFRQVAGCGRLTGASRAW